MSETNESSFSGKKIFFVNPTFQTQSTVIEKLINSEYEVYTILDYKILKNILIKNPNSICFINPDVSLSIHTWRNYLLTFAQDSRLKQVSVGIISNKIHEKDLDNFKQGVSVVTAGFALDLKDDALLAHVQKQLETHNAKGVRKFVRAFCYNDSTAEVYWLDANTMHKFKIVDISCASIAISVPASKISALHNGKTIDNAKVALGTKQVPIYFEVYAIKPNKGDYLVIGMLRIEGWETSIKEIRAYILRFLSEELFNSVVDLPPDRFDYNKLS